MCFCDCVCGVFPSDLFLINICLKLFHLKAIDIIDEAASRVRMRIESVPVIIRELDEEIALLRKKEVTQFYTDNSTFHSKVKERVIKTTTTEIEIKESINININNTNTTATNNTAPASNNNNSSINKNIDKFSGDSFDEAVERLIRKDSSTPSNTPGSTPGSVPGSTPGSAPFNPSNPFMPSTLIKDIEESLSVYSTDSLIIESNSNSNNNSSGSSGSSTDNSTYAPPLSGDMSQLVTRRNELTSEWQNIRNKLISINKSRQFIEGLQATLKSSVKLGNHSKVDSIERFEIPNKLKEMKDTLASISPSSPFFYLSESVTHVEVANIMAKNTGIPMGNLLEGE